MLKRIIIAGLLIFSAGYFYHGGVFAGRVDKLKAVPDIPLLDPIVSSDRVLIMAPHPDDESLGTAGIIQEALKAGADIRIAYLTSGEHNQLAFIIYQKRIVIKQKALISMGEARQKEAADAMKLLGVPKDKLIFLGYPDFGMMMIFLRFWDDTRPFKNMLTRVSNVPYKDALSPNAPYKGESVLRDIETVLKTYKPTKIFVTNSIDTNRDHRAYYLFLQVALWDLRGQIPPPKVYPYLIHYYDWPLPRNYHPEYYLDAPALLTSTQISWRIHMLSDEQMDKKYQAICMYKSQCVDSAFYLKAFARKNELFGDYPIIELDNAEKTTPLKVISKFRNKTISYARVKDDLILNVMFKSEEEKLRRFYTYLVVYSAGIEFSKTPKLKINVSENDVKVLNRGRFIKLEGLNMTQDSTSFTIKIPLKSLGNPEYLLASFNTYASNFASDINAWRIIKIK